MGREPTRTGLDPSFDVDAAPRVAQGGTLWPVVFGIVGALGLGTVVFLQLDANRARLEEARATPVQQPAPVVVQAAPPPAPVYVEPTPVVIEQPPIELAPPPPPVDPAPTQAELDRLRAPALVIDLGEYKAPAPGAEGTAGMAPGALDPRAIAGVAGASAAQAATSTNPDERFAQRFGVGGSSSEPAKAKPMGDLSLKIVEGAIIPAVLETALNSDLPGYTRAVVSRDVKGFDGTKVLVPRGSRLIGQYRSGVALGQSRAFVIWTRLIRPDGASIELASPATDGLGRGGLDGDVNRHFLQRFGGAILLSLLNIGAAAVADSTDTSVVIASTRAGSDAAGVALASDLNIPPTVTVPQGSPVRVFVSQDLDFTAVGPAPASGAPN